MTVRLGALAGVSALCLAAALPARAQPATSPTPPPAAPSAAASAEAPAPVDPILATVNGTAIRATDVQAAATSLPANLQQMPEQVLYPMLLDRMIDEQALADEARSEGLQNDPAIHRQVVRAEDAALQRALLLKDIRPLVTDAAVKARYDKEYAGKPGVEEVHAEHILVDNEALAKDIIKQLDAGANFEVLAKKYSKDSGAAQGGDLGFFKESDMVPAFAKAAFALQPGQITQTPVHTQFGWHVIKVLGRRQNKPPTFEAVKNQLRQTMAQEAAQKIVTAARAKVKVVRYGPDGQPLAEATPSGAPPAVQPSAAADEPPQIPTSPPSMN